MRLKPLSDLRKTLAFRLTLWYSAIFILSSLILFIVSYIFLSAAIRDNRKVIHSKLVHYLFLAEKGGVQAIEKVANNVRRSSPRSAFFIRVVGPDNKIVFTNTPELWKKFDLKPVEDRPAEGEWWYFPAKRGGDVLEVTFGYLPNGYLLEVGKDIEDREEIMEQFRETIVGVMIPMILIGLASGAALAFRALRPIRKLIHTTQSVVETGRMDARVPLGRSGNELDELAKLFNKMLERIESLIKGMSEALDNVAHDLRTPMTRLRGIAEMALRSDSSRHHDQKEALADCLEESDRVLTLLNTLMDISEAETGTMKLDLAALNVSDLIEEIVDLYEHVAEDKFITVSFYCPKNICITADRNRMRQVLANLLDNAVKYTDPKGSVVIDAYEQDGQIVIRVRDDGAGIPPPEISKIWDRLHRGDASRSQPGLGLGLSLVAAVVEAHRGRIGVQSELGGGSIFTLYIPSTPVPSSEVFSAH
jgi:signal transduction histidine kinase